jgi:DNA polymerase III sliding clamp (beta) subunit (PCNA family)
MPKVIIKKSDLMEKFSLIQAARGGGKEKPILQTIKVEGWKKGKKVRLTANNRMVYAHVEFQAVSLSEHFSFCADGMVFQIIATFPDDAEVEIEVTEKEVILTHGRKVHKIMTIPSDDFEAIPEVGEYADSDLAPIISAFEVSRIATAEDANRPALQCFNVVADTGKDAEGNPTGKVLTADGKQLISYNHLNLPGGDTLPRQTVLKDFFQLLKYIAGGEKSQVVFGNYTGFRDETLGAELIIQRMNAQLFDLSKLFEMAANQKVLAEVVIPSSALKSALSVCRIYEARGLQNGNPNTALLHVGKKEVYLTTSVTGLSDMLEPLDKVEVKSLEGEEQELRFSADLLSELFDVISADSIVLQILEGGSRSPFVITIPDIPHCTYLQMPTQTQGA